jgi:hypothetical protein
MVLVVVLVGGAGKQPERVVQLPDPGKVVFHNRQEELWNNSLIAF